MNNEMELFHKNYQKLKRLIAQSQLVFEKLNLNEENLNLKPGENFRLLIMGRDRKERIDLINSLFEREILNTTDLSASDTSIAIRWDERERSLIHFTNELSSDIHEENLIQIYDEQKEPYNMLQIEVPVSKLHKYIPLNKILDNIEIFISDSFCMDGIEILDIPELQNTTSLDGIKEILGKLNINLIVTIVSEDELNEIINEVDFNKQAFKTYSNSIFYIIKNSDNIINDERNRILQSLKNCTGFKEEGIFFISDLGYNKATNRKDDGIIVKSSILEVRDAIHQEHRKESLYKPLYDLIRIIKETILKIIGELYMTAEQNAQDVEMIYNRSTAAVRRALLHRENIQDRIIFFMERIKNSINEEVENFIECLPSRVRNHMEGQSIKQSRNPIVDAYRKIEEQVDMEMYEWIKQIIIPLIDVSIESIIDEEEYSLRSFCYEIDNISRDFGRARGIKQPAEKYVPAVEKFSQLLKIGKREELNEYIKSINESLVSKVIFSKRIFVISSNCTEKVTSDGMQDMPKCWDMVFNATIECIKEGSEVIRSQISEEILNQIEAFFEYVKVKINFESERVQNKVNYLQEYKNNLQRATDKITECERELKQIDNELTELLFETMGT
ncbi:MAG: dynamin family protein [Clostridiales bacterium]|nr:dynamin family protein [Clostridiales bacterium]